MGLKEESILQILMNLRKTGSGDKEASEGLEKTTKQGKQSTDMAKNLGKAWKGVQAGMVAAGAAFIKNLPAMIQQGDEIRRARVALEAYTGGAYQAQAAIEGVRQAVNYSLTDFEAAQQASRLFAMGMATNADEAREFTRVATTLGAAMGAGPQEALENFTLLLANESLLRLDTFGVSAAEVKIRMNELAESMEGADRSALFQAAAMEIATNKTNELEAAGFEAASSIDRLNAYTRQAKEGMMEWLADGYVPMFDGMMFFNDSLGEQLKMLSDGAATYEDYNALIDSMDGGIRKVILSLYKMGEAQFQEVKAAEAAALVEEHRAKALAEATAAQEINLDALGEALITMDMVKASINGKLGPAYDDMLVKTSDLTRENDLLSAHMVNLVDAGVDPAEESFQLLKDQYDENLEVINQTKESVHDLTTELIFKQLATGLDAQGTLDLARALGIMDERTLDVLQSAQTLKDRYDAMDGTLDGVIEDTYGFAQAAAVLRDDLASIPENVTTNVNVNYNTGGATGINPTNAKGNQHGDSFVVGGMPGTDRVPVTMLLDKGEGVEITPARNMATGPSGESFDPVRQSRGAGGGLNIHTINVNNGMDLAALEERLRRATR